MNKGASLAAVTSSARSPPRAPGSRVQERCPPCACHKLLPPPSRPQQCFGGSSSALLSPAPTSARSEVPAGPAAPCCPQPVLHIAREGAAGAIALQKLRTNPAHPREALHRALVLGFVQWVWKTAQTWRRMCPWARDQQRTAALVCAVSVRTRTCSAGGLCPGTFPNTERL